MMHWHIVCDFDGTVTRTDVIDSILERFAEPGWEAIEQQWLDGQIGSRECLTRQLALVRATPAQLLGYFDSVAIDPDFPAFVDLATSLGATLDIVSDGLEQAIARILSRNDCSLLPIVANGLRQVDHDRWRIVFPYARDTCRAAAGNCKCRSVPAGRHVLVIGDGRSDMCVAETADFVLARGSLADHCVRLGLPHARFDTFAEIPALLANLPQLLTPIVPTLTPELQERFHHV
ncbi:HAD-IB family phosphatase [uncultured Pseudomonas sp.]|uniref:HAD-IB family phosphatase n=1 Tax=uncultured Pseudomonas sp. TaxID=114707 RepID=UPI0025DCE210|nr:HAD-IB family phosphatase [uncultured Pseudomonas sp.]